MLTRKPKHSIGRKLTLLIVASVGIALIVATGITLWQETQRYAETKRGALVATAQVFATAAAPAAAARDATAVFGALKAIGRVPGLVFARLDDRNGHPLATIGALAKLDSDERVAEGTDDPTAWRLLTSRTLEVAVPVIDGGVPVGRLTVISDTSDLIEKLSSILAITLVGAVASLVIGLMVAARLGRAITRPLRSVTEAMTRIRQSHDFSARVDTEADDEVGVLVDGFNEMLGEIRVRDARLEAHLRGLEQEVAARTADLRVAKDAAEAANAAKSDFLATMSHEIRTPMNGIMVMAELLAASDLPRRQKRHADVIARSGQSLIAIINDILDFSKIEQGKLEIEAARLDPAELAENVVSLFAERARSKGLDLAAFVAPDTPRTMAGDPVRLGQVIGNLVNNALKFTETGSVMLSVARDPADDTRLKIAVSDTGIGIPEGKIEQIFAAFSQADQSTTRRFGGTGLGLAIARRLVEAMDSRFTVESEVGRGSTFAFSLPIIAPEAAPVWPRLPEGAASPQRAVLAFEGGASLDAAARYLRAAGFAVETASSASGPGSASLVIAEPDRITAPPEPGQTVLCLTAADDTRGERLVARELASACLAWPLLRSDLAAALRALTDGEGAEAKPSAPIVAPDEQPDFSSLKILVADDSAVNREVALEALACFRATADVVTDGRSAVEAAAAKAYDLILMDGSMPEMDGFSAARVIRGAEAQAGGRRVPIVALTAHVVGAGAEAWREAGMDGVLHKPFTIKALASCIAALVPLRGDRRRVDGPLVSGEIEAPVEKTPLDNLLDPDTLAGLDAMAAAGRADFVGRVLALYREHAPKALLRLEEAVRDGALEAAAQSAHALKSMSYNIGAAKVAALAAEVEHAARSGTDPLPDASAIAEAVAATLHALSLRQGGAAHEAADAPAATTDGHSSALAAKDDLARDIARGLELGEFWVAYQPQMDRNGEQLLGVEALLRWERRDGTKVSPAEFIPIAEERGLIGALGAFALRQACRDGLAWPNLTVAVNISAVEISEPGVVSMVQRTLGETGFPAQRLELELTETALFRYEERSIAAMRELQALGITIALDDFGTGFSSLMHLRRFPFNKIKIDKSFVANVTTEIDAATIVHALTSIGRALGKKVVAEGVETEAQHRFLASAGIHTMQGFLFSPGVAASDITAMLEGARPATATSAA